MDIMDQNGKREEMNDYYVHKSCTDCKTTKTPLWRSGPSGPKSLCNACGIRYRKKSAGTRRRSPDSKNDNGIEIETSSYKRKLKVSDEELKNRVMALGKDLVVLQQKPRSPPVKKRRRSSHQKKKKYWKKMGEVEEAAALLMTLSSCGSVLAQNIERGEEVRG